MHDEKHIDLTICIPTYNRADYLYFLLSDIYDQKEGLNISFEIIISDNASDDDTCEVIAFWKEKLPIRDFTQKTNIGARNNIKFTFARANGEFFIYCADDDLLDLRSLQTCLLKLKLMNDVGVMYTPWRICNVEGSIDKQFYYLPKDVHIRNASYLEFLLTILNFHIFPEVAIYRTIKYKDLLHFQRNTISYNFFNWATDWLSVSDIYFSKSTFYKAIVNHPVGHHTQAGNEEVKFMWDSYRGALEVILGKCVGHMNHDSELKLREAINDFVAKRMAVAIKLRLADKEDDIETFLLASRLKGLGKEDLLPIPFASIATRAAFSYLFEELKVLENNQRFILLGSYPKELVAFIRDEFDILNVQVCSHLPNDVRDSVILYKPKFSGFGISHFNKNHDNNLFISEEVLMKTFC